MMGGKIRNKTSYHSLKSSKRLNGNYGFTIVELLVVIVIIGILAAITVVSYTGLSSRAKVASIQLDLTNSKKQLQLYYANHGVYPTGLDTNLCPTNSNVTPVTDVNYCLKTSGGGTVSLRSGNNGKTYSISLVRDGLNFAIGTDSSAIETVSLDSNWLTIGSQTWAKSNLNVGTMILGANNQTNNGGANIVEKYCYNDSAANCTTYGALYQWDEAMNYSTSERAQGICPVGSHIPSDNDWKILESQLGMTSEQVDSTEWRGSDQGTQLKSGGSSGLNMLLAGGRTSGGTFTNLLADAGIWTSSQSGSLIWLRGLAAGYPTSDRTTDLKTFGFTVRCLAN